MITRKTARERILEVATDLFYREGIRAVGVDTIVAKSGVAKMSFYRSFPSKDDLVVAFLDEWEQRYWERWDDTVNRHQGAPRAQLLALFEAIAQRTTSANYRGCPFRNTATEFPEPSHRGREKALAHKRELRRRLLQLTEDLGAAQPPILADQLLLLMDGVYSTACTLSTPNFASVLLEAVKVLLDAQLPTKSSS